jgi:hypothetical protein
VVDGIAAMAENVGALRDVFWAPWHSRHVPSANCFPAAGSPTCWPKAMPMFAKRSGALHADERTGIIGASFGANVFTGYLARVVRPEVSLVGGRSPAEPVSDGLRPW